MVSLEAKDKLDELELDSSLLANLCKELLEEALELTLKGLATLKCCELSSFR